MLASGLADTICTTPPSPAYDLLAPPSIKPNIWEDSYGREDLVWTTQV